MKRLSQTIKHTPMLLALVFIAFFFFPTAIVTPGESTSNSIVTAIGLDKLEDETFEVTLLTFLSYPNQTYTERYEVISSTGPSVSVAFTQAGLQVGKSISLFHTHTAIVSEKMLEEDISSSLDYLARIASLPQSCILISTNKTSKTFLEFIQKLDKESDINLEELMFFNTNYIYWKDTTINSFYKGYYAPYKSSLMGYLPIKEGDVDGIPIQDASDIPGIGNSQGSGSGNTGASGGESTSSGQSAKVQDQSSSSTVEGGEQGGSGDGQSETENSGSGASSGGEKPKKAELINDGTTLLIKNGKKVGTLSDTLLRGLNWLNSSTSGSIITLENVNDEQFSNAKLVYRVKDEEIRTNLSYENSYPVYSVNIRLYLTLMEVNGGKDDISKKNEPSYLSDEVRKGIEQYVKADISDSLNYLIQNKADVLEMYDKFYTFKRKQTKKFMQNLDSPEDFLGNVVFKVIVSVYPN